MVNQIMSTQEKFPRTGLLLCSLGLLFFSYSSCFSQVFIKQLGFNKIKQLGFNKKKKMAEVELVSVSTVDGLVVESKKKAVKVPFHSLLKVVPGVENGNLFLYRNGPDTVWVEVMPDTLQILKYLTAVIPQTHHLIPDDFSFGFDSDTKLIKQPDLLSQPELILDAIQLLFKFNGGNQIIFCGLIEHYLRLIPDHRVISKLDIPGDLRLILKRAAHKIETDSKTHRQNPQNMNLESRSSSEKSHVASPVDMSRNHIANNEGQYDSFSKPMDSTSNRSSHGQRKSMEKPLDDSSNRSSYDDYDEYIPCKGFVRRGHKKGTKLLSPTHARLPSPPSHVVQRSSSSQYDSTEEQLDSNSNNYDRVPFGGVVFRGEHENAQLPPQQHKNEVHGQDTGENAVYDEIVPGKAIIRGGYRGAKIPSQPPMSGVHPTQHGTKDRKPDSNNDRGPLPSALLLPASNNNNPYDDVSAPLGMGNSNNEPEETLANQYPSNLTHIDL